MIDSRSVQYFLFTKGLYKEDLDGIWGPASRTAQDALLRKEGVKTTGWPDTRKRIAVEQLMFKAAKINPGKEIVVDGIAGPVYGYALELWQNHLRDVEAPKEIVAKLLPVWPRQKDIADFYGNRGEHQVKLKSPYPLYLDWDLSEIVTSFSIHEKCHDSALRVMENVKDHYGVERIHALGLDQFGGCLNVRKMRGGSSWSMHSWGCAIDWDANRNGLRSNSHTAFLAKAECSRFLDFWEAEGWLSLGRERDYDWMHVQAARL